MSERPPLRKVRLIVNPVAGAPGRRDVMGRILETLKGSGVEADLRPTEGPGHATELAGEAGRLGVDAVVAVGGDGTVNEALNGLAGCPVALATIPMGTSNILARELGVPLDPVAAARVVAGGRRERIDVGRANGRRFLMVVGVGWDAHVVTAVDRVRRKKGHLGRRRYLVPIAGAVLSYDFPRLTVRMDGGEPRGADLAFVCNTRNYAGWFSLAPDAVPDDGRFDFVLIEDGSPRNYVRWAVGALTGTLPRYRDVLVRQGREIRVDAARPVPYQIDGDVGGTTPLTVTIEDEPLEVIVP